MNFYGVVSLIKLNKNPLHPRSFAGLTLLLQLTHLSTLHQVYGSEKFGVKPLSQWRTASLATANTLEPLWLISYIYIYVGVLTRIE